MSTFLNYNETFKIIYILNKEIYFNVIDCHNFIVTIFFIFILVLTVLLLYLTCLSFSVFVFFFLFLSFSLRGIDR